MGYVYHVRKCGKAAAELEKMTLKCHHCGKPYRSKAGLAYHLRSEHAPVSTAASPDAVGDVRCVSAQLLVPPLCGTFYSVTVSVFSSSFIFLFCSFFLPFEHY